MTQAQMNENDAKLFLEVLEHIDATNLCCRDVIHYKQSCIRSLSKEDAEYFMKIVGLQPMSDRLPILREQICKFIEQNPFLKADCFALIKHKAEIAASFFARKQQEALLQAESHAQVQAIDYDDYTK